MLYIVTAKKDHTLGIRIDEDLLKKLETLAEKEDRSVSAVARLLIVEGLVKRGMAKK